MLVYINYSIKKFDYFLLLHILTGLLDLFLWTELTPKMSTLFFWLEAPENTLLPHLFTAPPALSTPHTLLTHQVAFLLLHTLIFASGSHKLVNTHTLTFSES